MLFVLFYVRAAPQPLEVPGGLLHYPFEDLAGWYRVRKALVLAVRGATTTCPATAVSLCVFHKLPIHGWLPRARFRHQFSHGASFDVSALLASALMVEDLAALVRLITVLKLITLCASGGSPCAPPIAPPPLPRTTNRQAVLPVNCPSC